MLSAMSSLPNPHDTQAASSLGDAGAAMRDRTVEVLTAQLTGLLERSKRRQLTPIERAEVDRLGRVIDTLQSMGAA